ncbi:MAG: 50S ribosome-binding GTPase [Planctomycetales bacterium]|nr:50S ribosome-binding GTPase [Planctomycetales bacterium]
MYKFWNAWRRQAPSSETEVPAELERLPAENPIPCVWLFGKTGSGKSSVVRYLTGAQSATIGAGYRPETKTSNRYDFPDATDPLFSFLDTRGLGEASYDPHEDIQQFSSNTQLMIVTVRVCDHALESIINPLQQIRKASPERVVILVVTCLHEAVQGDLTAGADAIPNGQEDQAIAPGRAKLASRLPPKLETMLEEKQRQFAGLYDRLIPVDLTQPEDGFAEPNFGGQQLKQAILDKLPSAYRQALLALNHLSQGLSSRQQRARWQVLASSALAGTAGAVPVPWVDIPAVLGIQTHLAIRIAKIYDQEIRAADWAALSTAAGTRVALRLAARGVLKFIPYLGMAAGAAGSFAFTYALGMSWDWYFANMRGGRVPDAESLKVVFAEQLKRGHDLWRAN